MLIVGGENLIDLVQVDEKDGLPLFQAIPGGSPFNVALAAGRQGLATRYLTPISTDKNGDLLTERLHDAHVEIATRDKAPSSLAVVMLNKGIANYAFYRENTAERQISLPKLIDQYTDNIKILHLGSLCLVDDEDANIWEEFATYCKKYGVVLSIDPNVRPAFITNEAAYRQRIVRLFNMVDILKLSDEDLAWLYPGLSEKDARNTLLDNSHAAIHVLTKGEKGSTIEHQQAWHDIPSHPITSFKDTVGAGDTFMASMLVWLAEHRHLETMHSINITQKKDLLLYASAMSALNCQQQGCQPPYREFLP